MLNDKSVKFKFKIILQSGFESRQFLCRLLVDMLPAKLKATALERFILLQF